jgi:DNA-binding MarR family transcriptional regulator
VTAPAGPIDPDPGPTRPAATAGLTDQMMRFVRLLKASAAMPVAQDRSALQLMWPLLHEGPMRLRDLAEHKGVDQSTVSRQAAHLVTSGLVQRDPDPADRRACLLVLTDRGRNVCQELMDGHRRAIGEALAGWSEERLAAFVEMFRDFNEAVEAQQAFAGSTITAVPGGPARQENT